MVQIIEIDSHTVSGCALGNTGLHVHAQMGSDSPRSLSLSHRLMIMALSKEKAEEQQRILQPGDPGLILHYNDEAIHETLGRPNAPIPQAATVAQSSEAFKQYLFNIIVATPVELSEHCVTSNSTPGQPEEYYPTIFERWEYNK